MKHILETRALVVVAFATGVASPLAMSAEIVRGGDASQMHKWQGRAGGLVHSDRVAHLNVPSAGEKFSVAYDKHVAERTNLSRGEVQPSNLGVTFDKEVAKRTNMTRDPQDTQTAQAPAQ